jgi:ribose transport system substrate-binding protein
MNRLAWKSGQVCGVLVALSLLGSGGCARKRTPLIAVIPETTAEEIWESAHFEAARIADGWHWDTYWNGPSREDDLPQQIEIMDRQMEHGAEGIILAPDHAVALISPVRAAVDRHIPVVIINNPLAASPGNDVAFVLNDDVMTGHIAAERILPHLKGKNDEVAVLGVNPNFLGSLTVADALKDGLHQHGASVGVIEQRLTTADFSQAEDAADDLLRRHPNLRAIVALNITHTRAAYKAILRAHQIDKIVLIGCEQDFDVIYKIRTGNMDSVIARDTRTMVRDAMQWIKRRREDHVKGETIIVAPRLVTRENLDSPEIQHVLATSGADE